MHNTYHIHLICHDLITLQYVVKRTNDEAPHCALSSNLCYFIPLRSKYFPQYSILKQPKSMFLLQCDRQNSNPDNISIMFSLMWQNMPCLYSLYRQPEDPFFMATEQHHMQSMTSDWCRPLLIMNETTILQLATDWWDSNCLQNITETQPDRKSQ
jgi:hypothetical protein